MIRSSYTEAFRQLREPRFRQTALIGAALSLVLLFVLYVLLIQIFAAIEGETFVYSDGTRMDRLGNYFSVISVATMLMLSVFLMAPVASLFTGLHLNAVADDVEARHYPQLSATVRQDKQKLWLDSIRYFSLMLGINMVSFMAFAIFGLLWGVVFFWMLNGWLLSREYVTMIIERSADRPTIRNFRQSHRTTLLLAGVTLAVLLSVPFLNLLMPVVGVAAFTHLTHALATRRPEGATP